MQVANLPVLHSALLSGVRTINVKVAAKLCDNSGCDLLQKDHQGRLPLHIAAQIKFR